MRRFLDGLYRVSGGFAALFLVAIVAIVFAQVCLNLADKVASALVGRGVGLTIPSYADFTGFFLAAASFLALAYTLRTGGHIRVSLVTSRLPQAVQRPLEAVVLAAAAAMAGYAAWYVALLVLESHEFGDMTSGMVALPLWIPQLPVAIGLVVLTIALVDELVGIVRGHAPSYEGRGENLLNE